MSALLIQIDSEELRKIIAEEVEKVVSDRSIVSIRKVYSESLDSYTEAEVLRMFNISQGTLANWRSDGRIAYEGTRGNLRYPKRSVDELLSSLRRKEVT